MYISTKLTKFKWTEKKERKMKKTKSFGFRMNRYEIKQKWVNSHTHTHKTNWTQKLLFFFEMKVISMKVVESNIDVRFVKKFSLFLFFYFFLSSFRLVGCIVHLFKYCEWCEWSENILKHIFARVKWIKNN